jgi:hypothetical protein
MDSNHCCAESIYARGFYVRCGPLMVHLILLRQVNDRTSYFGQSPPFKPSGAVYGNFDRRAVSDFVLTTNLPDATAF